MVATGEAHSVREFLISPGALRFEWTDLVETDPRYLRPTESAISYGRRLESDQCETRLGAER